MPMLAVSTKNVFYTFLTPRFSKSGGEGNGQDQVWILLLDYINDKKIS